MSDYKPLRGKEKERTQLKIILIFIAVIVTCLSVLIWAMVTDANSDRSLTIDGTILNVEHIGDGIGVVVIK